MSFLRRAEVGLDAKMDLQISLLEPDAAARGETGRFGFLGQSQDADIKRPRRFFSVRRHCQLHVFNCVDFHFNHIFQVLLETDCLDGVSVEFLLSGGNEPGYASLPACSSGQRPTGGSQQAWAGCARLQTIITQRKRGDFWGA
jgi:hypothetical protein